MALRSRKRLLQSPVAISLDKSKIRLVTKACRHLHWILVLAWFIALAGAFALDRSVAQWVHDHVPVDKRHHLTGDVLSVLKRPGDFRFTLVVAVLLGFFHRRRWIGSLCLVASSVAIGAIYSVVKWIVGRHRPVVEIAPFHFHPFAQGIPGIWREKALCFPSGHVLLAFATATCLAILLPRWWALFFAVALITATERIAENAHYLSDAVAGAGIGILTGYLVTRAILGAFQKL